MNKVTKKPVGNDTPGERLKILRKERGLHQADLAEEIEKMQHGKRTCSEKQISYIENGSRPLSRNYAHLFAKFFDVDAAWILCETDYRTAAHKFAAMINKSREESDLLFTGLLAFASLNGYTIDAKPLTGDVEEVINNLNCQYSIKKDGKQITLSVDAMNAFENHLCNIVNTELQFLFKMNGGL